MEKCQHSTLPKWETPFLPWKYLQLAPKLSWNWLHWCITLQGNSTFCGEGKAFSKQQLSFQIYIYHLTHENKFKMIIWQIPHKLTLTHDSVSPAFGLHFSSLTNRKSVGSSFHFLSHHCLHGEWKRLFLGHKAHGIQSLHGKQKRENGNSDSFSFLGLQNHCGQWLQTWN